MKKTLTVKGTNGILTADTEKITISRNTIGGLLSQGIKGERTIYYNDLKAIEYKKPTMMANGYIQLITNVELSTSTKNGIFGTKLNAAKDQNIIILRAFNKKTVSDGENINNFMQSRLNEEKETSPNIISSNSDADELMKFKKLLDNGIITKEEFDKKKEKIMEQ
ncbi:SHOCT domain-containing protein [Levilactobacillus brevis]|uniref:SHOCT domain-containing protein n=1 Tax=Levilactobacillus brevis TaxID=1580 RepID=UPI003EC0B534